MNVSRITAPAMMISARSELIPGILRLSSSGTEQSRSIAFFRSRYLITPEGAFPSGWSAFWAISARFMILPEAAYREIDVMFFDLLNRGNNGIFNILLDDPVWSGPQILRDYPKKTGS